MRTAIAEATQIISIDPVAYVAAVYAPFAERLEKAKADAVAITSFDVATKDGMALAVKQRAIFRGIRVEADKAREFRKAPIIKIGKLIQERYNEIEAEITLHEDRFDGAIKAEEKRKDDEKNAAIRVEQERIEAEARAIKEAEERKMAEERAAIAKGQAELAAQQKAAADKIAADEAAAAARIAETRRVADEAIAKANAEARARQDVIDAAARAERAAEDARQAVERKRLQDEADKIAAERRAAEDEARVKREQQEVAEREARQAQEMAMSEIEGIRQQVIIAQIGRAGVRKGGTIACIEETLAETEKWPITATQFGPLLTVAQSVKDKAVAEIRHLLTGARDAAKQEADRQMKDEQERIKEAKKQARLGVRAMMTTLKSKCGTAAEYAGVVAAIDAYFAEHQ